MFCLDYVLAFAFHSAFTVGAVRLSTDWIGKCGGGGGGTTLFSTVSVREADVRRAVWTAVTALGLQAQLASKLQRHAPSAGGVIRQKRIEPFRTFSEIQTREAKDWERRVVPAAVGLAAGSAAALALFPFDFVRD